MRGKKKHTHTQLSASTGMTSFGSEFKFAQLVNEFLKELDDDLVAPGQSKFQDYMPKCRKGMQAMEDVRP